MIESLNGKSENQKSENQNEKSNTIKVGKECFEKKREKDYIINVEHLNKQFIVDKKPMDILSDINLSIKKGEFITIVGHSGCGKSTLLKIMCGLVDYEDGVVERNGHAVVGPGPKCGMVFQDHRLLPWLKIKDNVGFGLSHLPKKEREENVRKHLEMVGLKGFENSYPAQLSGGMSQRAAIARGLANNPTILLLDEPFGALDALTRIQMQKEILRIQKEQQATMVMVTHDIDEAIVLGNRIVVMSARPGRIMDIIKVSDKGRERNSDEFARYKKKIYDYLFSEENNEMTYKNADEDKEELTFKNNKKNAS
ncbi:MAG: ABC transporter ATP-binding protein [Lachnospiraceae bacterium]|nr:ABC transporter ATP-binding protein [Lachnospiraceae bacterium]